MASSKEQAVSRPVSGSFSRMSSSNRSHSNSLSLSATNNTHRVHRRKSVNASASSTAQAAIAAALRENGESSATPVPHRRSVGSKKNTESQSMSARPSMHSYFGPSGAVPSIEQDTFDDMSMDEENGSSDKNFLKSRNRRASEGSHLVKNTSKKSELRCDTCGKGYKHSSCLTKHMWEHDPAWAVTSKLLISKHQQVQLLEAASVLCTMNADAVTDAPDMDVSLVDPSEASSASPLHSTSSDVHDGISSVETTPPPQSEDYDSKRYSTSSFGISRSYRSAASSSFVENAFSPALLPQRFSGVDFRPTTSGTDDGSLAAATAGLNFGSTPKTRASIAEDIPPVPPLPQQYASYSKSATLNSMHNPFALHPPSLTQQLSDERNYRADNEYAPEQRAKQSKDEGMFPMEL